MVNREIIDELKSLCQLDIDASAAYEKAIQKITETDIAMRLSEYRNDHERHIAEINRLLAEMGEQPVEKKPDMKGYLISGFTSLRSAQGTEGALKAMHSNEQLTNKRYNQAMEVSFPPEVKAVVDKNYNDEQRHLAYVEQVLGVVASK